MKLTSYQGFEYFEVYSRGREELVLKVHTPLGTARRINSAVTPTIIDVDAVFLIASYSRYGGNPGVWVKK